MKRPKQHSTIRIGGMTCSSCELLIERKLKKVPGVHSVDVSYKKGSARIQANENVMLDTKKISQVIEKAGYRVLDDDESSQPRRAYASIKWVEIGVALLIIGAGYKVLQAFDLVSLAPSTSGALSIGGIFFIGIVAGTSSCLAVTGGLLLALAAKHNEIHQAETSWEKFKPLLQFNIGRLISYFFLGGLIGVLGQSIILSTRATGYMNIVVAVIMFFLALSILEIVPRGSFPIRMPKKFSRWIADISESHHPAAPMALGAFTFFLPCGFTQSLQLVALASGNFFTGATIMFVFALGTLPSLVGISAFSSATTRKSAGLFFRFTGTLVLILALWNFNSGLRLIGVVTSNFSNPAVVTKTGQDPNVTIDDQGRQILYLHVNSQGYQPRSFTIQPNMETWIYAKGENAYGCQTMLTAPAYNLSVRVQEGDNWLGPILNPTKSFLLTCSMGMYKSTVNVLQAS